MAAFDDATKARLRYHLGYPAVDSTLLQAGGVTYAGTPQFRLEHAMDNVSDAGIPQVTQNLDILDTIEAQMVSALQRLQADKADVVTLNRQEHLDLQNQYSYWQGRICNQLDVTVNPYQAGQATNSLNVRVR